MQNVWELYESDSRYMEATIALDAAWNEAKVLAPALPSKDRALMAYQYVDKVMLKYAGAGASDTEPRSRLRWLIEKHFGVEI